MTEPNQDKNQIDLDQIELHTDSPLGRQGSPQPPQRRTRAKTKGGRGWLIVLLALLFLAAAGGAGYFYTEMERLRGINEELAKRGEDVATDLDATVNNLQDAQELIANLQREVKSLRGKLDDAETKSADLEKRLAAAQKRIDERQEAINGLDRQLKIAQDKTATVTRERNRLRDDLADLRTQSQARIAELEKSIQDNRQQYQSELANQQRAQNNLRAERDAALREKQRLERQFKEESDASLAIIRERAELKRDKETLQRQLDQAQTDLQRATARVRRLEETQTGDLVAFSEDISPARINYREPLPDGVRIPRKLGTVALQALINEIGAVEKAFIISGQEMEGELARSLVSNVLQWKFDPATKDGIRVKVWQTVLISTQ